MKNDLHTTYSLLYLRVIAQVAFEDFELIRRGSRLSVLPVSAAQWKLLLSLE